LLTDRSLSLDPQTTKHHVETLCVPISTLPGQDELQD